MLIGARVEKFATKFVDRPPGLVYVESHAIFLSYSASNRLTMMMSAHAHPLDLGNLAGTARRS